MKGKIATETTKILNFLNMGGKNNKTSNIVKN